MRLANGRHLTYCTNIHATRGVHDLMDALDTHATRLRDTFCTPGQPFGLGLRLGNDEALELQDPVTLDALRIFLDTRTFYTFTLNGFVHGHFHHAPVKTAVHEPDWRTRQRLDYTLRLADILAALLPDELDGSISTSPLGYRHHLACRGNPLLEDDGRAILTHLVELCAHLVRMRHRTGRTIRLALEPQPDGCLESVEELVRFFETHLLTEGAALLGATLGAGLSVATELLREHLGLCLDACHAAVAFEDPAELLARVDAAGVLIPKVQLSSALRVVLPDDPAARTDIADRLRTFVEPIYLHQVVARLADGSLRRFPDLDPALGTLDDPAMREWRVHFHVPVFCQTLGPLQSTSPMLETLLRAIDTRSDCQHLELETYTFDALPGEAGLERDLTTALTREFHWILERIGA